MDQLDELAQQARIVGVGSGSPEFTASGIISTCGAVVWDETAREYVVPAYGIEEADALREHYSKADLREIPPVTAELAARLLEEIKELRERVEKLEDPARWALGRLAKTLTPPASPTGP